MLPDAFLGCSCDRGRETFDGVYFRAMNRDLLNRITSNPSVMGGRPCVRGMRITVGTIVGLLAAGHGHDEILRSYPYLEPEDIQAALAYAAWRAEEVELPLKAS